MPPNVKVPIKATERAHTQQSAIVKKRKRKLPLKKLVKQFSLELDKCKKEEMFKKDPIIVKNMIYLMNQESFCVVMITYFVLSCLRIHDISWYGVVII